MLRIELPLLEFERVDEAHDCGRCTDVLAAISSARSRGQPAALAIGREIRTCLHLLHRADLQKVYIQNATLRKCKEALRRPAAEGFFLIEQDINITHGEELIAGLADWGLGGKAVERACAGHGKGDDPVIFPRPFPARRLGHVMSTINASIQCPIAAAACIFSATIMAHPYVDGNGRLARGLTTALLIQRGVLSEPTLPLAPAFYLLMNEIGSAIRRTAASGDWTQSICSLRAGLATAVYLANTLESWEAGHEARRGKKAARLLHEQA